MPASRTTLLKTFLEVQDPLPGLRMARKTNSGIFLRARSESKGAYSTLRPSKRDLVAHRPAEGVLMKKTFSPSPIVFQPSFIC